MVKFTEDKVMSDGNEFTTFQTAIHHMMVYPEKNAVAYLTLGLMSGLGELADIQRRIVRGDFKDKGVHVNDRVKENTINACAKMLAYLAELVTLTGSTLGDVIGAAEFIELDDLVGLGKEFSKLTTGTIVVIMGSELGDLIGQVSSDLTEQEREYVEDYARELVNYICQLMVLIECPLNEAFNIRRLIVDTGES